MTYSTKEPPPASELHALRQGGMTRPEIAAHYGVTFAQVKKWITDLKIGPKATKKSKLKSPETSKRERYIDISEGEDLMDMARAVLGRRIREDYRGYLLDGRPASSWQILKAANIKAVSRTPGGFKTIDPIDDDE